MRSGWPLLLAAWAAACVIQPNQTPDSGIVDGGAGDGGVDAGVIQGTVTVTVGTSSSGSYSVSWSGAQLAGSSSGPANGATYVALYAQSDTGGILTFTLTNLAAGTTSSTFPAIGYQAPSTSPDGWKCDPNPDQSTGCSGTASVTSYDGHSLVGTFNAQFGAQSSVSHNQSASLTAGAFNFTFP
jgi:hypothetical protein